jgi:hypothetical protein
MEALVLDGKSYVKASKAARDLGYTTDYVGQLCRSGQVDAHLIGRTWYVDQEQLGAHRVEKKRMSRVKAREQAKALIASSRAETRHAAHGTSTRKTAKNGPISYEPDEAPLIPETRKLSISSDYQAPEPMFEETEEAIVEDDAEETAPPEDTGLEEPVDAPVEEDAEVVILKPEIMEEEPEIRSERPAAPSRKVSDIRPAAPASFIERLEEASVITTAREMPIEAVPAISKRGSKYSFFMHLFFQLMLIGLVLASFPVRTAMTYDAERNPAFESHFSFSLEETINIFKDIFKERF